MRGRRGWLALSMVIAAVAAPRPLAAQVAFRGIGDLPGGAFFSEALGVSSDGTLIAGRSQAEDGRRAIVVLNTAMLGLNGLAVSPDLPFDAGHDVASNPAIVVGESDTGPGGFSAVRWINVTPEPLWDGVAYAISFDRQIIVGQRDSDNAPVMWSGGVVTALDTNPGTAYGVSADGSVIVGASGPQAFSWVDGVFGLIPGLEIVSSVARDVADNGLVIGGTYGGIPVEAFRWVGGIANRLGGLDPNAIESRAFGVSGNGLRVVGESVNTADELVAFYWDGFVGMKDLKDLLVNDHGLDLTGWTLERAEAISTDGSTIVGWGTNPLGEREGWVATLPIPPPLCGDVSMDGSVDAVDVNAFRASLADPTGTPLGAGAPRCTVIPPLRPCDLRDVVVIQREVAGTLPPGILQICSAIP